MSCVESVDQPIILNEFLPDKLFLSPAAMKELERMQEIALNTQIKDAKKTVIISLNIRSLIRHHQNLLTDPLIEAQVIALQETWCHPEQVYASLEIPGYRQHLVSQGRGKGVATYFKGDYQVTGQIKTDLYQISKVSSSALDVLNVYCSQGCNKSNFLKDLGSLVRKDRPCFIVGDLNIDYSSNPNDIVIRMLEGKGFKQLVQSPTHLCGGTLDHIYVRNSKKNYKIQLNHPYYSDHAALSVAEL